MLRIVARIGFSGTAIEDSDGEKGERPPVTMIEKIRDSEPDSDSAYAAGESVLVRLAVRLYKLRISRDLTQAELAERSGVDQANISDIENGDANPTAKTIGRLAAGLGVNAAALLDRTSLGVQYGSNLTLHEGVEWEGKAAVPASSGGGRAWSRHARTKAKVKQVKVQSAELSETLDEQVGAV